MTKNIHYKEGTKEFVQVQYAAVRPFRNLAKKDRVSISNTNNTLWFHVRHENELLGCCGVYLGKDKCRFKSVWLLPQSRGTGMFSFINDCRTKVAQSLDYKKVEVLTLHPDHYAKRGFNLIKETNHEGVWLMETSL